METKGDSLPASWPVRAKRLIRLFFGRMTLFILLAAILWFLNALKGTYETSIRFPVEYVNIPKGRALSAPLPDEISLKVSGSGYALLQYTSLFSRPLLTFDMSALSLQRDNQRGNYYTLTRQLFDNVGAQLAGNLRLLEIRPDTIRVNFSTVKKRMLPVKPAISVTYQRQYLPKGKAVITPDSVEVTGPAYLLDTMTVVHARSITQTGVKDTIRALLPIAENRLLQYSHRQIEVLIPVEKHTEATLQIPIVPVHFPPGVVVKLFPAKVTLHCMVGISDYEKLDPALFRVIVNYKTLGSEPKLRVELENRPEYISQVSLQPRLVEFIMEK